MQGGNGLCGLNEKLVHIAAGVALSQLLDVTATVAVEELHDIVTGYSRHRSGTCTSNCSSSSVSTTSSTNIGTSNSITSSSSSWRSNSSNSRDSSRDNGDVARNEAGPSGVQVMKVREGCFFLHWLLPPLSLLLSLLLLLLLLQLLLLLVMLLLVPMLVLLVVLTLLLLQLEVQVPLLCLLYLLQMPMRPTLEPPPLITAHLDYTAKRNVYDDENRQIQESRHARPDANLPDHTRQGLPDPHTWLPRCTNLHSKATFHTYPINPQTDIVGTGKCETFLQLHPHMTTPATSLSTGDPIMPKHDLVQHVTVHDESGRTIGLLTKQQHQHLHTWLQHTPHTRDLATELVALLRRQDAQSNHHPMRAAQDKALTTLHNTRNFPSTVQRWADPLTVRPETTTYWSPDINDTAFGAHHNCLLLRHTGLSTWNVPADDAVALKCVNHAIHSATQEEAMATIMLIPGKKGISYPKHIDTLRRYPEYCQHLASIPPTKTSCSKPGKHANLHIYVIWNAAGQQLVTNGNPQGWLASTATALHPQRDTPNPQQTSESKDLPTSGHQRSHSQLTEHSTTQPRMAINEWATLAYTDGSCIKASGAHPTRVGAGVYIPENNVRVTVAMDDPESNTINKAELTAIHAALTAGVKRIATDSLCSIYQIRRALANPMSLITHRHNDILTAIATLITDSPVTIHFYKAALHPELANTPAYRPTTRKETNTWLSSEADGDTPAPLPDCRQSVRAHMHRKHSLGLANQDSIYYQMSQEITKAAAKGAGERVMTDTNISTPAQRTALLYRTGGLYN
ncbi:hypothetical protein QJQ45_000063 [Haematococcus lacustris]|nr:hypothetical protein QJQ45_000063 [Haematococcus lacustris]